MTPFVSSPRKRGPRWGILFAFCAAVLLLTSCANISVKDFGPYWNQGTIQRDYLGWWETSYENTRYRIRVINREATYHVDFLDENGWEVREASLRARTLHIGTYLFLMNKTQDRTDHWVPFDMYRYKIENGNLKIYSLDAKKMRKFLAKNFPHEKNIKVGCEGKCFNKNSISIIKLDTNVYKILSSIPDTKYFWTVQKNSPHKAP